MIEDQDAFIRGQEPLFQEIASRWHVPGLTRDEVVQDLRLLTYEILRKGKYDPALGSFPGFFRPAAYNRLRGCYRSFNAKSNVFLHAVQIEKIAEEDPELRARKMTYEQNGHAWREFLTTLSTDEALVAVMSIVNSMGIGRIAKAMWWRPVRARRILESIRTKAEEFFQVA